MMKMFASEVQGSPSSRWLSPTCPQRRPPACRLELPYAPLYARVIHFVMMTKEAPSIKGIFIPHSWVTETTHEWGTWTTHVCLPLMTHEWSAGGGSY